VSEKRISEMIGLKYWGAMSRIDEIRERLQKVLDKKETFMFDYRNDIRILLLEANELFDTSADQEAEIARLETQIKRAKTYIGIEAYPCPLCEYKEGKFISLCSLHEQIKTMVMIIKSVIRK